MGVSARLQSPLWRAAGQPLVSSAFASLDAWPSQANGTLGFLRSSQGHWPLSHGFLYACSLSLYSIGGTAKRVSLMKSVDRSLEIMSVGLARACRCFYNILNNSLSFVEICYS